MKLTIHQSMALWWLMSAPVVFAPVIENAKRPDAGPVMAWGIATVAVMILSAPMLLRWSAVSTPDGRGGGPVGRPRPAAAPREPRG